MNSKENQKQEGKNEEQDPVKAPGLGELLRVEREKKGLSYERVSQITRLRKHFIIAIENEDWDSLPPSVFIRGFIRSYAKALGLKEQEVLNLYQRDSSMPPLSPRQFIEPKKLRIGYFLTLILFLGILAFMAYRWIGMSDSPQEKSQDQMRAPGTIQNQDDRTTGLSSSVTRSVGSDQGNPPLKEHAKALSPTGPRMDASGTSPPGKENAGKIPQEISVPQKPVEPPMDDPLKEEIKREPAVNDDWLTLTGSVNGRTWIRIYIDDQAPKEYMFQPGNKPQWKAKKGFNILVGNASGIEFDFNGKQIGKLGNLGQVVRLRLPENFKAPNSKD
jgi:cytoskeleton protein RodZ